MVHTIAIRKTIILHQNNKMPEMRASSRPALADVSAGSFFIRRMAPPGVVVLKGAAKPLAGRTRTPSSNKENVPPAGTVRAGPKRSPLPDWYPRTPLRDITSIVKAIEKRRNRPGDVAAWQQIQWTEDSSHSVDPIITPVQTEQDVPQGTPTTQETLAAVAPVPGSIQVAASPAATCLAESKLKASDCSLQATPSRTNDPGLADLLEKLSSSIEQIEKMVRGNLKETLKAAQPSKMAAQRRTLRFMR